MITILNRKEVFTSFSLEEQVNARQILSKNRIPHVVRTEEAYGGKSLLQSSRARYGTFGQNMNFSYQYYIYVNRKDYEEASSLLAFEMHK